MRVNVENIPRTIMLVRSDESFPQIPNGFPILVVLDQTKLPHVEDRIYVTDWREVIDLVKSLKVRGAPAIGIAGAAAMALRAAEFAYAQTDDLRKDEIDFERVFVIDEAAFDPELYLVGMEQAGRMIKRSRPTAVNLEWAVDRCMKLVREEVAAGNGAEAIAEKLYELVCAMIVDDEKVNRAIGANGAELLPNDATVLTHCNAGSLATSFFGTALGIVYTAAEGRGIKRVYSDETRPVGQGVRLTTWELSRAGVPVTLICDDMAASVMSQGDVDAVIVGADRIAANGDVANKIGTLGLAVLARHFGIPFYVAAPTSTIDVSTPDGEGIPVEVRDCSEVIQIPIEGVDVHNPAFDVTPASLVTKIVTENGAFDACDVKSSISHP